MDDLESGIQSVSNVQLPEALAVSSSLVMEYLQLFTLCLSMALA